MVPQRLGNYDSGGVAEKNSSSVVTPSHAQGAAKRSGRIPSTTADAAVNPGGLLRDLVLEGFTNGHQLVQAMRPLKPVMRHSTQPTALNGR